MLRPILMAGTLALAACGNKAEEQGPPPPPTVSVATPLSREINDWDEYVGRFEAIQDVEVMPRVTGQITAIGFRPGVEVGQGQMLFRIDPRPFEAALAQARAQVLRGQATLANARSEAARSRRLLQYQAVSKEESEQRDAAVRTAAADLAAAEAAARNAALNLSFTTVRAPIRGRVSDKRVAIGDQVAAGTTLLTRVVSVNPIWFTFDGAESFYLKYIREAREGGRPSSRYAPNPVDIQLADEPTYRWHGRMTFVDNAIDPNAGTIRAHAEVANPNGFLVPGMFGRARLLGSGSYRAMLVPPVAIVTDQSRKFVWVVGRDGKPIQRDVQLGPIVDGLQVIRSGLAPTERVVIDNIAMLQPGAAVKTKPGRINPIRDQGRGSVPVSAPPPAEATTAGR